MDDKSAGLGGGPAFCDWMGGVAGFFFGLEIFFSILIIAETFIVKKIVLSICIIQTFVGKISVQGSCCFGKC